MLRWCRIVANQPTLCTTSSGLQARAAMAAMAARARRRLPTTHLFRTSIAQHLLHRRWLGAFGRHENAKAIIGEPRVVLNRAQAPSREGGVEQDPENGRERTEQ